MLPLADHNPRRSAPVVNVLLIVANVLMFLQEVRLGNRIEPVLMRVAFVPARERLLRADRPAPPAWLQRVG